MYFATFGLTPGEWTELGNEVRIGQEAHVEHQVGIFGDALAEAEAHARDQDVLVALCALEALGEQGCATRAH